MGLWNGQDLDKGASLGFTLSTAQLIPGFVEQALASGLFGVAGNWLEFAFLADRPELLGGKDVPRANGRENAYKLLVANPEWANCLQGKVRDFVAEVPDDRSRA